MNYKDRYKRLFKRMKSNKQRYEEFHTSILTKEEKRIWEICEQFGKRTIPPKDDNDFKESLDEKRAHRLLDELEKILDQLGW